MKNFAARKNLKIRMTASAGVEKLKPEKLTVLYRVAQESLTNIGRHADASLVDLRITEMPEVVSMVIHDNGKSFDVAKTLSSNANRRLGLLGMRERIEMVGGTLTIESAAGYGTTIRADVPLERGGA